MKEFIALLTDEKQLRMHGKIMTLTFFELYTVYIKIRTIFSPHLHVNLFKERCISSVKNYKYFNRLISKVAIKALVLTV